MTRKTRIAAACLFAATALPVATQAQVAPHTTQMATQMATQTANMWQLSGTAASRTVIIQPVTQDIASSIGAFYDSPLQSRENGAVSQAVDIPARTTIATDRGQTLFGDVTYNNDRNFAAIPERGSAPSRADTRYTVIRTGVSLDF